MATVSDGTNPGRSATPQRQSPSVKRAGHGIKADPTNQLGQVPPDVFGFSQSYSTGLPGSQGGGGGKDDVTTEPGQFDTTLAGVTEAEITGTGMPYKDHMSYLREQVVLVGTGGLLTTLAGGSSISGGGPAAEHADAFDMLADGDAARIHAAEHGGHRPGRAALRDRQRRRDGILRVRGGAMGH